MSITPHFETISGVTSYHGRAEDVLPTIADRSIDCILTDPPYFGVLSEDWDNQWEDRPAFLGWLDGIAAEWQRVLAANGSLYVFAWPDLSAHVEVLLSERFRVLNRCRYQKTTPRRPSAEIQRRWTQGWEACIFAAAASSDSHPMDDKKFNRGSLWQVATESLRDYLRSELSRSGLTLTGVIKALGVTTASHYFAASQWQLPAEAHYDQLRRMAASRSPSLDPPAFLRPHSSLRAEYDELRARWISEMAPLRESWRAERRPFHPSLDRSDLWVFNPPPPGDERHPAEKPLPLLRHLIATSTRPGDLILDCFAGRASIGAAAIDLRRRAILVEQDEGWFRAGLDRLRDHALVPQDAKMAPISGPLFDE